MPDQTAESGDTTADNLVALSRWIDAGNAGRDPEAITWGRLAKITEEAGEVISAYIGYTGQNPRKGTTHKRSDVVAELLDVAVAALGAVEHLGDHQGLALLALEDKINAVAERAGVATPPGGESDG
ncbi:MazG-like family protein [Nocardioides soli]|uniref:NTP pyrophosphatase (Non-canonical NTP hydrolase) n=1 Tax=Nocardioides soli TaxID=1036020 RepID=A0A7W4VY77_9ACTN|nr:MazG-like family protein [Nocardioides soli]MBB3043915.1 NTP pyrophosphatase (non-canonical NTP hydrolase) [Nocardioides soli]